MRRGGARAAQGPGEGSQSPGISPPSRRAPTSPSGSPALVQIPVSGGDGGRGLLGRAPQPRQGPQPPGSFWGRQRQHERHRLHAVLCVGTSTTGFVRSARKNNIRCVLSDEAESVVGERMSECVLVVKDVTGINKVIIDPDVDVIIEGTKIKLLVDTGACLT
ncbi:hypothetical protein NDU88_007559 [Pleurodeles waltl]|uniref:Peptidase A2 domain-containing protein n=1 Tax=Pleurodeles waltl TaxID=8319 RepID=A0AAV7LSG3_PLEWA|nr:hypothetical protein NDU88_007559 [Pleurodeles waltl]